MHPYKRYFLIITILMLLQTGNQAWGMLNYKRPFSKTDSVDDVFIRIVSSKKIAYNGEAFIVKYLLYNTVSVIDPQTEVDLKFKNCYQEQYPANQQPGTEKINGKLYNVVTLKQYLVIAANTGRLDLPRLKIHIKINAPAGNDFFGQEKLISKTIYANALAVSIKALPAKPDTTTFSGAVGDFKTRGGYKPSLKNPNLLLFHLTVDGAGNAKTAAFINPQLPNGIDIYNVNTTGTDTLNANGITTHKQYAFQLVANYRGVFTIPAFTFSFFNPQLNKYETFTSGSYKWQVNKGPIQPSVTNSPVKQQADLFVKKNLNDNINPIYSHSGWYYFLLAVGLMAGIYSCNVYYFNRLIKNYLKTTKTKQAKKRALKSIKKLITASPLLNEYVFSKRLTAILHQYIQEKSNSDNDEVPALSFENSLFYQNLPASLYKQVITFLNAQHRLQFGATPAAHQYDKLSYGHQLIIIVNNLNRKQNA